MTRKGTRMSETKTEATEHDAIVSGVMSTAAEVAVDPAGEGQDQTATAIQVKDRAGVVHTLRNPELSLTFYPAGRRINLERGPIVEEEAKLGSVEAPEGAEDLETAIATIIALRLVEYARQHNRQVFRIANTGNGPAIAAALREAGEYVLEFPG
jgi:hypothetical protein